MASSSSGSGGYPSSGPRRVRPAGGHRPHLFSRSRPSAAPAAPSTSTSPSAAAPPVRTAPSREYDRNVVLDVQNLKTYFFTYDGVLRALEGINLQARAGETTGIVGETGCGKSVTAFSIARLIGDPGRVMSGKIFLNGADLLWGLDKEARYKKIPGTGRVKVIRSFRRIKAANDRLASVRGRGISMIFQEPGQAMNPVFSIADQLGESVLLHRGIEVVEGMLRADAAARGAGGVASEEFVPEVPDGGPVEVVPGTGGNVERMIAASTSGDRDALRAAATEVAASAGLPSLAPELFYLLRDSRAQAPARRARVMRAIHRVHLSRLQRNFLKHQRRVMLMQRAIQDLYLKEMKLGKSQLGARSRIALRIRFEKLRNFYFGLWGVKRSVNRPLKNELFWRVVELLEGVRIANPVQVARGYPHELSGGMLQRAMIAMALSSEPALLIADEPTTALDVTIQAQILDLMNKLRERVGTAIVLITHDLGVVAEVCDRVNVMYAGLIIESGPVHELFRRPLHPYTQGLLASIPRFDQPDKELASIPGSVPNLIRPPPGCRFHPRCPYAMPVCKEVRPEPQLEGEDHMVACHLYTAPPAAPATPEPAPPPTVTGRPATA
ncbi:MAG TPA: ABC transporter ATP-binding protein [Thermoplasmata archaeon]|nr:ABC transporter ATP-binding protein [Thermoplasmata archaeon]